MKYTLSTLAMYFDGFGISSSPWFLRSLQFEQPQQDRVRQRVLDKTLCLNPQKTADVLQRSDLLVTYGVGHMYETVRTPMRSGAISDAFSYFLLPPVRAPLRMRSANRKTLVVCHLAHA